MESPQKVSTCFIVDDNKVDRLTTFSFVRNYSFLQTIGQFENAETALEAATRQMPDVIFLDMDMPGMNGLDLRARLAQVPVCIFITAFPDYALPAFEANALDFLIKPIGSERFAQTMSRLQQYLGIREHAEQYRHSLEKDVLFIKEGRNHVKIHLSDILYLEALKDYTGVVTRERKYCVLSPLSNLLSEKVFHPFVRIHRSYAANKTHIRKFNTRELLVADVSLPVGRVYRESLNAFLIP